MAPRLRASTLSGVPSLAFTCERRWRARFSQRLRCENRDRRMRAGGRPRPPVVECPRHFSKSRITSDEASVSLNYPESRRTEEGPSCEIRLFRTSDYPAATQRMCLIGAMVPLHRRRARTPTGSHPSVTVLASQPSREPRRPPSLAKNSERRDGSKERKQNALSAASRSRHLTDLIRNRRQHRTQLHENFRIPEA